MITFLLVSNVMLWVAVVVQIILFFTMARAVSQFMKRFQIQSPQHGEAVSVVLGSKAPLFSEADHRGEIVTLNKHNGNRTLILFTYDTCHICQTIIQQLFELHKHDPDLRVVVAAPEDLGAPDKLVPAGVSLIRSNSLMENYNIRNVPFFVLINVEGYVIELGHIGSISDLIGVLTGKKLAG
ncbi:AhpC/TSA family protein [Tumebacillus sp. BK434]|uniref:TlpA family protein disulfide reductase n=1 Tax=Tumebacillus sp. BK434 TaxID=2512169 RepID=UPI00104BBA4B|nr:redoxin domain-containing protein [Tumebacillus sp. BK434]TCP53921.1 AhpC/TSA family protein [Tumebacillus sp. BK434]